MKGIINYFKQPSEQKLPEQKPTCPTCGKDYKSNDPIFCSNSFHLPEPLNVKGATVEKNTILRKHLGDERIDKQSIRYAVYNAMQECATLQRNEAIQECIPLIEKCEKTFGIINDILKSLQEAQPADLYLLVREVDIDLPLIQAKIKDELIRLKR